MTALSLYTKNGQTLQLKAGSAAIAQNDLVAIGGPGSEAYTVKTNDYASVSTAAAIAAPVTVATAAPTGARQAVARDAAGNVYILNGSTLSVTKYNPVLSSPTTVVLDANAFFTPKLVSLSNGNFAAVYARAAGALYFVVFDAALNIIAGPTSIATAYAPGNTTYHDAIALNGGGFAIAYQISGGAGVSLATYSNAGAVVQAATSVQTLSSTAAIAFLRIGQLSNGNLVVAMRTTMTPAGTSFVVVTTAGVSVVTNTVADSVSTAGFLELSVLTGYFAVAAGNGTNLKASVYTNAGTLQGSAYSVANTLNSSTAIQLQLVNDGGQFWMAYIGSAANGVNVVQIPVAGSGYVATTGLSGATLAATTYSLAAGITNGMLTVFVASTGTGNLYWLTVGLPDSSLGINVAYLRTGATSIGTAAATTGTNWPNLLPVGDWTVVLSYAQTTTAALFAAVQKVEASSILGISQTAVALGNPGSAISVNGGPGQYSCNTIAGTLGISFNHSQASIIGNLGILLGNSIAFGSTVNGGSLPSSSIGYGGANIAPAGFLGIFGSGQYAAYSSQGTYTFTVRSNVSVIRVRTVGAGAGGNSSAGGGGGGFAIGIFTVVPGTQFTVTVGAGGTGYNASGPTSSTAGGTSSFGSLISATGGGVGGTSGAGGVGVGGYFQAAGGIGCNGSGGGGGGGGAGSQLGTGGSGGVNGTSAPYQGGCGGGGVGNGANGGTPTVTYAASSGGGGSPFGSAGLGAANGLGGPDMTGAMAAIGAAGAVNPVIASLRFPFDGFTGGGGGGSSNASPGGAGGVGAGGGGGTLTGSNSFGGNGGVGGGGGGAWNLTNQYGGKGGLGGGGGGAFNIGGAGGDGVVVIEW